MCGILGGWHCGKKFPDTLIHAALAEMKNRGPDDEGYRHFNIRDRSTLLLGHTRLSILDLSNAGHQPMSSYDDRFSIIFNGEIYNYKELRQELQLHGRKFSSDSDTEVLLSAWDFWGAGCLNKLSGMFAFTVFDKKLNTLTSVRDGFGIKPFFYNIGDNSFFFASEIEALITLSKAQKKICHQSAYDYLVNGEYDNNNLSFFDGIKHLLPGHLIEFNLNSGEIQKIEKWHSIEIREKEQLSFDQAAESIRNQFLENIKLHLRSDVPLGAALSGGIDSSAVVCAMRYLDPKSEINTFSYVARGSLVSEERWIDFVNEHINAKGNKVIAKSNEFIEDVDKLIKLQGEPFGSTSIYASYRVFKLAKEKGIKVTLDGQGADELFAGYRGYPVERMQSLIDQRDILELLLFTKNWSNWPGRSFLESMKCLGVAMTPDNLRNTVNNIFLRNQSPNWLDKFFLLDVEQNNYVQPLGEQHNFHGRNVIKRLARSLQQNGIPQLLRHADRNSMQFSVESRVPFLTSSMANMALTMPESYLISNQGETKSIFREAMRGIVPDIILDRKDKIGFLTPEKDWLFENASFFRNHMEQGISSPIFNQAILMKEFNRCIENKKSSRDLWRWINFVRWCQLNDL